MSDDASPAEVCINSSRRTVPNARRSPGGHRDHSRADVRLPERGAVEAAAVRRLHIFALFAPRSTGMERREFITAAVAGGVALASRPLTTAADPPADVV